MSMSSSRLKNALAFLTLFSGSLHQLHGFTIRILPYRGVTLTSKSHDVRNNEIASGRRQGPVQISMQDQQDDLSTSNTSSNGNIPMYAMRKHTKLSTLKDRMWVREALEDLAAAEFACSIAASSSSDGNDNGNEKKRERAVDFENILAKLEKRISDMCVLTSEAEAGDDCIATFPDQSWDDEAKSFGEDEEKQFWILKKNFGMGSVTYTDEQRNALVTRLLSSRSNLLRAMSGKVESTASTDLDQIREQLQTPDAIVIKEKDEKQPDLYVREDGTIDWDGALQDRAALKKFGISVWARINGQDADDLDENSVKADDVHSSHGGHGAKKVTVKIADTPEIRAEKEKLEALEAVLLEMEKNHYVLLNSAVSVGSAVANVNLAKLEPQLRSKIRASNEDLERKRDEVAFQRLNYEIERIFTYLDGELGNTSSKGYIPLQDRLNVAEFGLLESQLDSMNTQIASGETIDSDVLSVMLDATADFKRRLGIDYYVTGLTFDKEAIKIWANDLLEQSKAGLAFYAKGVQLLWNDIVFSISLISRALQGYTLKPREVRTLRRTFKDILTFIPFIIILIIPLTPIGHVLVFGAIQRFFPDFFPSCFTERRQNLFSLYESTEYSAITIEENWKEKLTRISQAAGYVVVDSAKKVIAQISDTNYEEKPRSKDESQS
mmetsp:Transcript_6005/g.11362  ORF Transcript_6005/g.11362 Transcript_6005/m.11362 type:complete len:665 (-) Transcript_6005:1807-3801(-)